MPPLQPPDTHHLSAATGWIELGNAAEAHAELAHITPSLQSHPDVLEVRWQILAKEKNWEACVDLANGMVLDDFNNSFGWIHRSYALHELKRTQEAFDHLETAVALFPNSWHVRYNLACYCCQLKRLPEAQKWLAESLKLGDAKAIKQMAAEDPDLEPLRAIIEK
ncbi:MAG TPA: tetratricopeptide repeat protein [Verrucomicrobiae bacterium]|nr:tetratricopeptide repeat protein [Verrucomicrobiae bacterium]